MKHCADGERWWFSHHLAGDPAYADIDWTMVVPEGVPAADVVADYRAAIEESALRWVLAHKTAEIARHLGHMDILREQIDEVTGR